MLIVLKPNGPFYQSGFTFCSPGLRCDAKKKRCLSQHRFLINCEPLTPSPRVISTRHFCLFDRRIMSESAVFVYLFSACDRTLCSNIFIFVNFFNDILPIFFMCFCFFPGNSIVIKHSDPGRTFHH